MKDNIFLAMKEEDIHEFCVKILECADNISLIFTNIDKQMNYLNDKFTFPSKYNIMVKYNSLRENFDLIHNNLISYSEDFANLQLKADCGKKEIQGFINNATDALEEKSKEVI